MTLTPEIPAVLVFDVKASPRRVLLGSLKTCIHAARKIPLGETYAVEVTDETGRIRHLTHDEIAPLFHDPAY
jgi:hypothetical protein